MSEFRRRLLYAANIKPVNWLQNDGTAWIETGYSNMATSYYLIKFTGLSNKSKEMLTYCQYTGKYETSTLRVYYGYKYSGHTSNAWNTICGNSGYGKVWTFEMLSSTKFRINGGAEQTVLNPCRGGTEGYTVKLFYSGTWRLYRWKAMENGETKVDLIPALDENGVPGMYDRIGGVMHYNAAESGAFTYG